MRLKIIVFSPSNHLSICVNKFIIYFEFKTMECLRCPACSFVYTDNPKQLRQPRVLILCGHTFCHKCIQQNLQNQQIACFTCQKVSFASNSINFPINQSLIVELKSRKKLSQHLCKVHNKMVEVYCEKQKELICLQCSLTAHKFHNSCLISVKAQAGRALLKSSLDKIIENYNDSKRTIEKLTQEQSLIKSTFLDLSMQIGIFYKHVMESISCLQQKQLQRLNKQKEQMLCALHKYKTQAQLWQSFHKQLQQSYNSLSQSSDIEFILRQNQQSSILNNCKPKNTKYTISQLEFKRVNCLQQIMNNLQEMINFEKKKMLHSNNMGKEGSALHGSPSVKKTSKEPAVLQVNLSEQYNKRKISQINSKKSKPTKKVINISSDKEKQKEKIIEAVASGRGMNASGKQGKTSDLKFIRQSSIKKNKQTESFFFDQLEMSQNFAPFSVNSFMRSSRESQMSVSHLNESSIKQSFNSFSLFQIEEKVYHLGGRAQSTIQKYYKDSNKCQKINMPINRKGHQLVYHKPYSSQKCLVLGGISNTSNQTDLSIYEFNFKTQKLSKSPLSLSNPRSSFGCVSKEGSIFMMGGRAERPLNTFQKLTIASNNLQIIKMPNMVQAREDLGFCLGFDGFIYVAGGVNNSNNILNSCQRYNEDKKAWEAVRHMKHQRRGFALVAVPHGILAIGGHSNLQVLSAVQLFDFNSGEWIDLAPMNEARCYHSAVLSRDYQTITIFGGFVDKRQLDSIQIYEIDNNRWVSGGKMRQKRCLHASILSPF